MIKLNKVGKILKGDETGFFIEVEYVEDAGYYIYTSSAQDFLSDETYDALVETREDVKSFFEESGWVIDWEPEFKKGSGDWVIVGIILAENSEAQVRCPECNEARLIVQDVEVGDIIERWFNCPVCKKHNSLRIKKKI